MRPYGNVSKPFNTPLDRSDRRSYADKPMKILITGGAGFIASHIQDA